MSIKILPFDEIQGFIRAGANPEKYKEVIEKSGNEKVNFNVKLKDVSTDLWLLAENIRQKNPDSECHQYLKVVLNPKEGLEYVKNKVSLEEKDIFLGGSHVLSKELISKFLKKWPKGKVIIFDAHLDFSQEYKPIERGNWVRFLGKGEDTFKKLTHIGSNLLINDLEEYYSLKESSAKILALKGSTLVKLDANLSIAEKKDVEEVKKGVRNFPCYVSIDIDAFRDTYGLWPQGNLEVSFISEFIKGLDIKCCDIMELNSRKGKSRVFHILKIMKNYFGYV